MGVAPLLHAAGVVVFGVCTYYDIFHLLQNSLHVQHHPMIQELFNIDGRHGGRWKFLTIWGLTVQLVYHTLALVNDVGGSWALVRSRAGRLQRARDTLLWSLAFPVALQVCVAFWVLCAVDRELVYPPVLDEVYPRWMNHGIHTAPLVMAVLEVALVPHQSAGCAPELTILLVFTFCYLAWTMYLALGSGVWVYGVMKVLSWPLRFAFMAVNVAVQLGYYALGKRADAVVWGRRRAAAAVDSVKKAE